MAQELNIGQRWVWVWRGEESALDADDTITDISRGVIYAIEPDGTTNIWDLREFLECHPRLRRDDELPGYVAPVAEPTPGQVAYTEARNLHRIAAGVHLPRWPEIDEADRAAWERCSSKTEAEPEPEPVPVPEPMRALAADDSAQRFEAQAHAFAVKSGEDRELIKVLLRRLLRELEGGA